MKEESLKGTMEANNTHEFFVLNLTTAPLTGEVSWLSSGNKISINVDGLAPASISEKKQFFPSSGNNDKWNWSVRGRDYQLNCYSGDRYAVVTISNYGIGVLVTDTSPDTWKW